MPNWHQSSREIRAELVARFPNAIAAKGAPRRPLKIGIRAEACAALPERSRAEIRHFFQRYTGRPKYLRAMVEGAARVNLAGEPDGVVTAEEAAQALSKLRAKEAEEAQRIRDRQQVRLRCRVHSQLNAMGAT